MPSSDVAYWGLSLQLIGAVQTLYNPITDGIYPEMLRTKSLSFIRNVLKIIMPLIAAGCIFSFVAADLILRTIGGEKYMFASATFRCLVPVLLFSFPAMTLGWPTLGAIGKAKEVTFTTILTAAVQVVGLALLGLMNVFSLVSIALLRSGTECLLFISRLLICIRCREEFAAIQK